MPMNVLNAHDLLAWTITPGMLVLSVHVVVTDDPWPPAPGGQVLDALNDCLADHFRRRAPPWRRVSQPLDVTAAGVDGPLVLASRAAATVAAAHPPRTTALTIGRRAPEPR
ncbi:MAG TPA: hypothetical protein VES03_05680 [Motilibacterales bacterium]|nr:hypothetical protein [Motilibacterales bacterium]